MCELCNIQSGDCEVLMTESVEVIVGGRKMKDQDLELYISNSDGKFSIDASYYCPGSEDPITTICMPISHCPWCGRKLGDIPKIKFPWKNEL